MKPAYDIFINLGCSLISFFIGILVHSLIRRIQINRKRVIWKTFCNQLPVDVAVSMREGPNVTSTPRVALAEVMALADAFPILRQMSIKYRLIDNNQNYRINKNNNIISIGGPKANDISSRLLEEYKKYLPIKITNNPFTISVGERNYSTKYSEDNSLIIADYAVVMLIVSNSKNDGGRMVVFGGRGIGTRGALKSISDEVLIKQYKKLLKNRSFVAVLKISGQDDDANISIVEVYPFSVA